MWGKLSNPFEILLPLLHLLHLLPLLLLRSSVSTHPSSPRILSPPSLPFASHPLSAFPSSSFFNLSLVLFLFPFPFPCSFSPSFLPFASLSVSLLAAPCSSLQLLASYPCVAPCSTNVHIFYLYTTHYSGVLSEINTTTLNLLVL